MLYRWNNGKFKEENLKKLERNWQKWKSVSPEKKSGRESNIAKVKLSFYFFSFSFLLIYFYILETRFRG